jgi:rhodanese-related sulfurtransferase
MDVLPLRLALFFLVLIMPASIGPARADTGRLASIDADLQRSFPDIGHVTTAKLAEWILQATDVVLVDVRSEEEFAVGRIEGAIRVSPGASARDVAARLREAAPGTNVVFYCSVGVRSSRLANRSRKSLMELGAAGVYNLSGGIFTWHEEARPLVDAQGPTRFVHPYDSNWGRLLSRQTYVSEVPDAARGE